MSERFNATGVNGRDCPICLRTGTLSGERGRTNPLMECSGCFARFRLTRSDGIVADTLERIRATQALPLLFALFLLVGCAEVPRPSPEGPSIDPPDACKEMIERGGKC